MAQVTDGHVEWCLRRYPPMVIELSSASTIIDATEWEVCIDEPAGADEKLWLLSPDSATSWLFKPVTEKNGHVQGEDWAELLAYLLAGQLEVPSAEIRMAVRGGRRGSLSKDLRVDGQWGMYSGSTLLAAEISGYIPGSQKPRGRPGHSPGNISMVLQNVMSPLNCGLPTWFSSFDVFAGYLVFDAWIANRDRHDDNWAISMPYRGEDVRHLCASYDHAGSFGYNMRDIERARRLSKSDGVRSWALRGTAHRFEHQPPQPQTLVALAHAALRLAGQQAREHWLDRLWQARSVDALIDQIPASGNMSDVCRTFVCEIPNVNRRRLLDDSA